MEPGSGSTENMTPPSFENTSFCHNDINELSIRRAVSNIESSSIHSCTFNAVQREFIDKNGTYPPEHSLHLRKVSSIGGGPLSFRYVTSRHVAKNLSAHLPPHTTRLSLQLQKELDVVEANRGALYYTLHALLSSMRLSEFCPLLVQLTSITVGEDKDGFDNVYLALLVNKEERDQSTLLVLEPMQTLENTVKIHYIFPLWSDMSTCLKGDGSLLVQSGNRTLVLCLPSVRCFWAITCALNKARDNATKHNYYPGGPSHRWLHWYNQYHHGTLYFHSPTITPTSTAYCTPTQSVTELPFLDPLTILRVAHKPKIIIDTDDNVDSPINRLRNKNGLQPMELVINEKQPCPVVNTPTDSSVDDEAAKCPTEKAIVSALWKIMTNIDLDDLTCGQVRRELESMFKQDLTTWKEFIDVKMMMVFGQMEESSEIFDQFLFLGTEWNASNRDELDNRQIGYILNMAIETENFYPELYQYCHVQIYDESEADITSHLDEAIRFIEDAKEAGSRVLVHCQMGVSRSATAVIAYGMKSFGWTLEESFTYVKHRRHCIQPNKGFMEQLKAYEKALRARRDLVVSPSPQPILISAL